MTKTINLEGIATTQSQKIGALGFGSKKNCFEYLNSSSLSILNEKCIAFIYDTIASGFNRIVWDASGNNLTLDITRFTTCMGVVTIKGTFTLNNYKRITNNDFTTAHIELKITLPHISDKKQSVQPSKYMGDVKSIKYGNAYYNAYAYTLSITE